MSFFTFGFILGYIISLSGATPINVTFFLWQNFSIPDPNPESMIIASVLNAALTIPANVLPALYVIAPDNIITGVGWFSLSLSQTSEILKLES